MSALQLVSNVRDRTPPWDEEAEVAVLGACVSNASNEAVTTASALLEPEMFYRETHRRIFRAMLAVSGRGVEVDPITVGAELENCGDLDRVGSYPYLAELMDAVPTAANVAYHANLVRDMARRRRLIEAGTEIVRIAYEPDGMPVSVLVDRAEQLVAGCAEDATGGDAARIKGDLMPVLARMEELAQNPGALSGATWGLGDVDQATGGLHRGDLVIVAGRPSMGKTAFVTGVAANLAIHHTTPVALFSLEMSRQQVTERIICAEALVDLGAFRRGSLGDADYARIAQAVGHLHTAPLWIDDSGVLSVAQMRSKLRRIVQAEPDLGLVVVDYVQLMSAEGRENRTQEVSAISRGLKQLAREFNVPVVALSQLSRAVEQRSNKRPVLSDLRESGAIEQDADLVAFLYREEYYLTAAEAQEKAKRGTAELIIGKQRNGPTGPVDLYFRAECARFEGLQRWGNRQ